MRIAVIGSGIAGMGAAWLLSRSHEVDVFESDDRLGGHACTVDVTLDGVTYPVDIGFMVFNPRTYPNLIALFEHVGIAWRETDMSFSVHVDDIGLEWAGTKDPTTVFAQPGNAVNPKFLAMLTDIARLSAAADRLASDASLLDMTLGQLLERENYGDGLCEWFLVPMASSIWSTPPGSILEFPASSFIRFCKNHGLLELGKQPVWRTVIGGSCTYVDRLRQDISGEVYPGHEVARVSREGDKVHVGLVGGEPMHYDAVVVAAHAPDALKLLLDPSDAERDILSSFHYEPNRAVLHTDESFLPVTKRAHASWNYWCGSGDLAEERFSVTYDLSRLQGHASPVPILLTLNPVTEPDPAKVVSEHDFSHPTFTPAGLAAQQRIDDIQGERNTYFAGAWQRYGFHEDGLFSAVRVARALGAQIPWDSAPEEHGA